MKKFFIGLIFITMFDKGICMQQLQQEQQYNFAANQAETTKSTNKKFKIVLSINDSKEELQQNQEEKEKAPTDDENLFDEFSVFTKTKSAPSHIRTNTIGDEKTILPSYNCDNEVKTTKNEYEVKNIQYNVDEAIKFQMPQNIGNQQLEIHNLDHQMNDFQLEDGYEADYEDQKRNQKEQK